MQAGLLDDAKLRAALEEQSRWGGKLGKILVQMNFITEDMLIQALGHQLHCPFIRLDGLPIPKEAIALVPLQLCEQHGLIPFALQAKFLDVAMADPLNAGVVDQLRILTRLNIRPHLGGPEAIERAIQLHHRGRRSAPPQEDVVGQRVLMSGSDALDLAPEPIVTPRTPTVAPPMRVPSVPPPRPPVELDDAPSQPSDLASALARVAQLERTVDQLRHTNQSLGARVEQIQALLTRDEDVLRKLLALLVERGVCTREDLVARISKAPPG